MKTGTLLVAAFFALTSFPFLAQQTPPALPPGNPGAQQSGSPTGEASPQMQQSPAANPAATSAASPAASAAETAAPEASASAVAVELRPVSAELVSKLDTKTAKTGDEVVVQTKAAVKTAEGTEIPKGSKLVGHVLASKPSTSGDNSQVVLRFDEAQLSGGKNLPIHTEIQSISPAGGDTAAASGAAAMDRGSMTNPSSAAAANGEAGAPGAPGTAATTTPGYRPGDAAAAATAPAANSAPAAGTIVARNGKIAIRSTSVPGVLLANNAPGEQDPRMSQASGILLGAKKDVQLDGGTQMIIGVAATSAGSK